jgi:hypothetical protein
MVEERAYSGEQIGAFIKSWKDEIELRQKEIYEKHLAAAMGGVVTVVVTVGLAFDKVAKFGWFERGLLGAALIFLILAAGNILNCTVYATNAHLELQRLERALILKGNAALPEGGLAALDNYLIAGLNHRQVYFKYTYFLITFAVAAGVVGFFAILIKG